VFETVFNSSVLLDGNRWLCYHTADACLSLVVCVFLWHGVRKLRSNLTLPLCKFYLGWRTTTENCSIGVLLQM